MPRPSNDQLIVVIRDLCEALVAIERTPIEYRVAMHLAEVFKRGVFIIAAETNLSTSEVINRMQDDVRVRFGE